MLAKHPLTGKDIRIIQTDASLWKETKTLAFVSEGSMRPVGWDTVSRGRLADNQWPTYLFVSQLEMMEAAVASNAEVKLFLVTKELADSYGIETFRKNNIQNVICLDELKDMYPHLGDAWTGEDADAVCLLAGLLRYRYLAGAWAARADYLGLKKQEGGPMRLWWITQYYVPEKTKRARELQTCLAANLGSRLIDRVILLNEKEEQIAAKQNPKLEERVIGKRLTYRAVYEAILGCPDDVIVAFANADIAIDDGSWAELWSVEMTNKFLALLRYDVGADGNVELFGPRPDSQDTWVIRAADVKARGASILQSLDFPFGKMGCDNAIALDMLRAKFVCINPAMTLKTLHYHASGLRTYNKLDVLDRPVFHYIHPSGFHDSEPLLRFSADTAQTYTTLQRPIQGGGANEWLVSTNRKVWADATVYKRNSLNEYKPGVDHVIQGPNMFLTGDGLFFDSKHMYIGGSSNAQSTWSKATIHAMVPTLAVPRVLSSPWPSEKANTCREEYTVRFLAKILRLWSKYGPGEFFCPEEKHMQEVLEYIQWKTPSMRILKREKDVHVWAKEFVGLTAGNEEVILAEDIEALRSSVKGWVSTPRLSGGRSRIVIVEGGAISPTLSRELEDVLDHAFEVRIVYSGKSSVDRSLDMLRGAWAVICDSTMESCGWNWMLPKGAHVFNVDKEGGRVALELSSAAGLEHHFVPAVRDKVLEEVWAEEKEWKLQTIAKEGGESLPIVWIPNKDREGYFGHPGDSFREMVQLWASSGYCRVKEHPTATMVWWNEIGGKGCLLYDRPTHDWRLAAPLVERDWAFGLFGNPAPPVGMEEKSSSWFFWPRRPSLVEELVGAGRVNTGWKERAYEMVFYGKTENKVQAKRRETANWSTAFVGKGFEWTMVKGDEAYGLTQKQYLERLADSKFGLCLAGYGFKCHREVECMAMGCVPVCDELVDMSKYAEPPVEGVHYIRVSSPEEARKVVEEMTEDLWTDMSAACKAWWTRNCSCEGSFALTKKILEAHQKDVDVN